jgi:hypothetical protein
MAIGTAAAIGIGLAGVGAAASASANRSASNTAARTSQQATDQSIALQRESRGMALQRLDPFMERGNVAGNAINAMLGLGGSAPVQQGGMMPGQTNPYVQPAAQMWGMGEGLNSMNGISPPMFADSNPTASSNWTLQSPQGGSDPVFTQSTQAGGQVQGQTAQQAADDAFANFRNSSGYRFRVNEGMDALNSGFAGAGLVQSGAALRALDDYRQNAASAELGNFMGLLGQQQAVGAGAASASAGVSQNFANNAGDLIMNNAGNQANAAIARAQNNPVGNVLGVVGGGLFGLGGRR